MEKWEYMTMMLYASESDEGAAEYAKTKLGDEVGGYSPRTLMKELDQYGREGWELVHMQPVDRNKLFLSTGNAVDAYFCAFKRRITE